MNAHAQRLGPTRRGHHGLTADGRKSSAGIGICDRDPGRTGILEEVVGRDCPCRSGRPSGKCRLREPSPSSIKFGFLPNGVMLHPGEFDSTLLLEWNGRARTWSKRGHGKSLEWIRRIPSKSRHRRPNLEMIQEGMRPGGMDRRWDMKAHYGTTNTTDKYIFKVIYSSERREYSGFTINDRGTGKYSIS